MDKTEGTRYSLINTRTDTLVVSALFEPRGFLGRARGLIGTRELRSEQGMLLRPCSMVHMFFMRYPIDVVFCDNALEVLHLCSNLRPWRLSPYISDASIVIELSAGRIEDCQLQVGDVLKMERAG